MKSLFVLAGFLCAVISIPISEEIGKTDEGTATTEFVTENEFDALDYADNSTTNTDVEDDYDMNNYDEEFANDEIYQLPRVITPGKVSGALYTDVTLYCEVYSVIPVTIMFANATNILQTEVIDQNFIRAEYVISNLTEEKTGKYWCYALNDEGIEKETIHVTKAALMENLFEVITTLWS